MPDVDIYMLIDPRDGTAKYVGRTIDARARKMAHTAYSSRMTGKAMWARALEAEGMKPVFRVIETVDEKVAAAVEARWIRRLQKRSPLLNIEHNPRAVRAREAGVARLGVTVPLDVFDRIDRLRKRWALDGARGVVIEALRRFEEAT